jgi:sugar phosphate permease
LSYPVFGAWIDRFGWPGAFLCSSLVMGALAIAWLLSGSDGPDGRAAEKSPRIAEQDPSLTAASAENAGESGGQRSYGSLALLTVSYAAVGYFQYLFFYWMQYYFDKVRQVGPEQSRILAMIPTLAMAIGMVLGGWLTLRMQNRFGRWRGLAAMPILGMLSGAAFTLAGVSVRDPNMAVACFSLAMGSVGAAEGPFWTVAVALGGRRGGTSAAIFNTGGNVGGLLAPILTPLFSGKMGWQAGISVASVLCVVGALCWFWIDPRDCDMEPTA